MRTYIQLKTEDLSGRGLEWAVLQPESDQPKTFACHHNMPTCMYCEWLVKQWLIKELGPMIDVPEDI